MSPFNFENAMERCSKKIIIILLAALIGCAAPCFAGKGIDWPKHYSVKERQEEEAAIYKRIEERLDWQNRSPDQQDEIDDSHRMLIGGLDVSILLRQSTGERFGIFEGFDDFHDTKIIELRLHKKNKLTDRFPVQSADICNKGADISADKVAPRFIVFTVTCRSTKYGDESTPYLFDYASRNLYQLAVLDYDSLDNKAPDLKLENGIYKMRWNVRLRGEKKTELVVRNFKIMKTAEGKWTVKELPPIDGEAAGIAPLEKLPVKPDYDLPAFVAGWGK